VNSIAYFDGDLSVLREPDIHARAETDEPMRSPRRTDSPGFFQETTRRAIRPRFA